MPVVIIAADFSLSISQPIENLFFGGNLPLWLSTEMGITYDQRNSMVVGFAMGFAVIPTIFSISEDAIYSVPKQLTTGSLALGATKAETMWRTVLPVTASAMITGLILAVARAAGEVAPLMLVGVVKLAPSLGLDGNAPFVTSRQKIYAFRLSYL